MMNGKQIKLMRIIMIIAFAAAVMIGFTLQMDTQVYADSGAPAMSPGAGMLGQNANSKNAQTVWYADKTWHVIGYNGSSAISVSGAATLMSTGILVKTQFDGGSNVYANSMLRKKIEGYEERGSHVDGILDSFSDSERGAIRTRTLVQGTYDGVDTDCIAGDADLENVALWPLSTKEESKVSPGIVKEGLEDEDENSGWWLRSPGKYSDEAAAVIIKYDIFSDGLKVNLTDYGARPVFYLDLNSVLFTSAAYGGKSSGTVGEDALTAQSALVNSGKEWKVTVKDNAHAGFTVSRITAAGSRVSVEYKGAATGTNEYISAVITNKPITEADAAIKYYGRIKNCTSDNDASGTVTINAGNKLHNNEILYIFNEQCNGDKKTDYASSVIKLTDHGHGNIVFVPWTGTEALPAETGNYYLTEDVYMGYSSWVVPSGTTRLCLNGHSITSKEDHKGAIVLDDNSTLNLYDDPAGGSVGTIINEEEDGVYFDGKSAVFNMYGGKISGCDDYGVSINGDAVFNMYGGEISGCDIGVKIDDSDGSFRLNNGIVTGNKVGIDYGTGTFKIAGTDVSPQITGNTKNVIIKGNGSDPRKIAIASVTTISETARIGISLESPAAGIFTDGLSGKLPQGKTAADIFTSDDPDYYVGMSNGEAKLVKTEPVAKPTFSPAEGKYNEAQDVTISSATEGAAIYYTTDGSDPTTSSARYSSKVKVSSTSTIKAIAVKTGMPDSEIASAAYEIDVDPHGNLDAVAGKDGGVFVAGWAFDPSNTTQQIDVAVYIGGEAGSAEAGDPKIIKADTERNDVDAVYHCGDHHGFDETITTDKRGEQKVYVYAKNTGEGKDICLGNKTVTITEAGTQAQYQLEYDPGDGGSGSMAPETVKIGDKVKLPECSFTAPSGKKFHKWQISGVDGIFDPGYEYTVVQNSIIGDVITVTATWKETATVTTVPKGKKLTYTGADLELVTAGAATNGTMKYALGTDAETAPTDGWSKSIPAKRDVGTYYVWYKAEGDANHSDSDPKSVEATITADKTDLNKVIEDATKYYTSIKDFDSYKEIAAALKTAIDNATSVAEDDKADLLTVYQAVTAVSVAKAEAEKQVAEKEMDEAVAALAAAEAAWIEAETKAQAAEAAQKEAEAKVKAAEEAQKEAEAKAKAAEEAQKEAEARAKAAEEAQKEAEKIAEQAGADAKAAKEAQAKAEAEKAEAVKAQKAAEERAAAAEAAQKAAEEKAAAAEAAQKAAEEKAAAAEAAQKAAEEKAAAAEAAQKAAEEKAAAAEAAQKAAEEKLAEAEKKAFKPLARMKLKKKTRGRKAKIIVEWNKGEGAKGYIILVSKNKKGTKKIKKITVKGGSKTRKVIKKLKRGKYYVKIRSYKKFKGNLIYGRFSKAKKVKVK